MLANAFRLSKIPRLVKDVVSMAANALASEHGWEAKAFCDFILGDEIVGAFGLANNKFSNLRYS